MSFLLLLIFATVQLTWWSNFKYAANLGAFAAMRTAMVGGTPSDQLIAARQVVNVREGRRRPTQTQQLRLPPLVPMTRTVRGGGGPGLPGGLFNNLLPTVNNLLNLFQHIPGLLPPSAPGAGGGGASTGSGGGSAGGGASTASLLGGLGSLGGLPISLPPGLGGLLNSTLGNLLNGFGGGGTRMRRGLGYVIYGEGGYPIQDGVRLVGWSHVTEQPAIGESGDNGGGFFAGFGGFSWGSLPGLGLPGLPGLPNLPTLNDMTPEQLQQLQDALGQINSGGVR